MSSIRPFLGPAGILYARARHLPLVASYHTDVPGYARAYGFPWAERGLWEFFRALHNRADLNGAVERGAARCARTAFGACAGGGAASMYAPVRPLTPDPAMRARLSGDHPDDFLMLYVGRVAKEKGLDPAGQAAATFARCAAGDCWWWP